MAFSTSGSTDDADGMTCVCTTSIIGNSNSSSPLPPAVTHGCRLISVKLSRLSGFTSIMPRNKLWQSGGTKCGIWNTPRFTFSNNCRRLSSSNGNAPTNKAYKITPHDQTSARRPSYFSPYVTNGQWEKKWWILFRNFIDDIGKCDCVRSILQLHFTYSNDFRTGIVRRAARCFQHRSGWLEWCHTEIGDFYIIFLVQQQILWFQITMTENATKWNGT